MPCSQIVFDSSLSALTSALARLARVAPDRSLLERVLAAMETALEQVERALELGGLGLQASAHDAYIAALTGGVVAAAESDAARFAATARRMMSTLEPLVSAGDRTLGARLLPCLQ